MSTHSFIHGYLTGYLHKAARMVPKSTEPWAPSFSVQAAPPPPDSAPLAPPLPKPTKPPDIESNEISSKKTANGVDRGTKDSD